MTTDDVCINQSIDNPLNDAILVKSIDASVVVHQTSGEQQRPSTISAVLPIHTLYIAPKVDPDRYQVDVPDLMKSVPLDCDDTGNDIVHFKFQIYVQMYKYFLI